jgi:hypothetical protein
METKIYIAGTYCDIKIIEKLLGFLTEDKIISKKINDGALELVNLGAGRKYDEKNNKSENDVLQNTLNLSKEIDGCDKTNKAGFIFCNDGVEADNYPAMHPTLVIGFPRNSKQAKVMRTNNGVNVLPFSSEYLSCPNPVFRILRERNLFKMARAFILAKPCMDDKIIGNKACIYEISRLRSENSNYNGFVRQQNIQQNISCRGF